MSDTRTQSFLQYQHARVGAHQVVVRRNQFIAGRSTIVLLHGIGVSSAYFVELAAALDLEWNVIALDLPGYGPTPKPKRALSIAELAVVTREFLEAEGLTPVVLVGHSMGCQIASSLHRTAPRLVSHMILLAPTVDRRQRHIIPQAWQLFMDAFREPLRVNRLVFRDYMRMGLLRYLRTSVYMLEHEIEKDLKNTRTPTMIVRGEKDHIVSHDWVTSLTRLSPAIEMREVPGAPHVVQCHSPKVIAELCRRVSTDEYQTKLK